MNSIDQLAVNTIRFLAADGVQKANSGHPGMPMGMADCAYILWTRFLKYNPDDTNWLNRDRFVLSAGHGSMLLYSMLHLAGYNLSIDDLMQFRQWGSKTPGHPEANHVPGAETTTGPLGQGFANGVGMALAMKILASRFNIAEYPIFDHHVYAIVSDGDLMEGISSEAASIAGHLGLDNLIYIYDDNSITIEGKTDLTFSENVSCRFESYGWNTIKIDGHNHEAIARAIQSCLDSQKPSLICARTTIGYGSPNANTSEVHGAPLGKENLAAAKANLGFPPEPAFFVPDEVLKLFAKRKADLQKEYKAWNTLYTKWEKACPEQARLLKDQLEKRIPQDIENLLIGALPDKPGATRAHGGKVINRAAECVSALLGGSADLSPSTKTDIKGKPSVQRGCYSGANLHFGIREHAMAGILNGMSLYGGFIPYGSTFLVFSDYMRPSIRLAALMKLQILYIFTHDSIFVGEDGPTHQPVEHAAALRTIPGLDVFRPADALETAMAFSFALKRKDGPTAVLLTRQTVPNQQRISGFDPKTIYKGGYVLSREDGKSADVVMVATGSEVSVAMEAKNILKEQGLSVRVVSMPSVEVFDIQDNDYRESVVPGNVPITVIEAGIEQGWHKLTRAPLQFIGMKGFGTSGPYEILAEKFGFTGQAVAEMTGCWLKKLG
jgi:transketolase